MMSTVLQTARALYSAGFSPLPVAEDGTKAPDVSSWVALQTKQASIEQVRAWDFEHRTGVGVATGCGDLTMFEFDEAEIVPRFIELARASGLGELVERISAGYDELTPSEGTHWFYRCSDTKGNTTLAKRPQANGKKKALIQTRGRGGYAIVAPSHGAVHPTGKPYFLRRGGFATVATITPDEQ